MFNVKKSITKNNKDIGTIVCFAGCDWWYHNRGLFCPQIMLRLAKRYKVLFVNSLAMRFPNLREDRHAARKMIRKLRSMICFLRKADNGMYVFTPISLPFFRSPVVGAIIKSFLSLQIKLVMSLLSIREPIVFVGCPPALEIVKKLRYRYLVYQRTDVFEEMSGVDKSYVASLDDTLTRTANLVLYVNSRLCQEGSKKNTNSLLIGHGVDFERFAGAEKSNHTPEDIAAIPKPVIGFFGDITEDACDFALLAHIAKTLPNMSLVLVGPISSDVSVLQTHKNIYFLGQKPYDQIPHYGKCFDVAIMPWKKNKWIEFCNPVKTKEYLAIGKPIVSVDYPELEPYHDIVYAASDYSQFANSIRRAVEEHDPKLKQKRRERVRSETWDNKVEQLIEFIEGDLCRKSDTQ